AVTPSFTIYDGTSGFGHMPRARYSPDVSNGIGGSGGFLVVWDNGIAVGFNSVRGRTVSYAAGAAHVVSGLQTISNVIGSVADSPDSVFMENRPTIAYSRSSGRFLVAWTTEKFGIQGRLLDANGTPLFAVVSYESGVSRDPALTWNPATNEFGMANSSFNGTASAQFRRIRPSDGVAFGRNTFGFSATGTFATGIDVNSLNQYVMTWGVSPGTYSSMFDMNGTQLTSPTFVASTLGGDLSMGLAYNPVSNSFLVVSSSWVSYDVGAVELGSNGAAKTSTTIVTSGASIAKPSFYPLVTSRTSTNQWNVIHSRGFLDARNQIVTTGGAGGGSTTTTTTTTTTGCSTPDPFASIGGGTCVNGGWVPSGSTSTSSGSTAPPPTTTTTTSSTGCTTPDPFTSIGGGTCVNGGWVPGHITTSSGSTGGTTTTTTTTTSTGCTGTDPFAAIGGGHCVNGGWVPGAATTSSTCSGPDPFASIGGGVCVSGGWVPASGGCLGPDPFASIGGGVCIGGGWVPKG
ncbi:MAG TPA: hypothetical protein VEL79_08945, partial [Vicinamibacterales bacterium]|nr:hypothetical protein [Vicinamibacterales bacterium]